VFFEEAKLLSGGGLGAFFVVSAVDRVLRGVSISSLLSFSTTHFG
jgi:hypothetical protein